MENDDQRKPRILPTKIPLSDQCALRLEVLFQGHNLIKAKRLLVEHVGETTEIVSQKHSEEWDCVRFALLKISHGEIDTLEQEILNAKGQWDEILKLAGFEKPEPGQSWASHLAWFPKHRHFD